MEQDVALQYRMEKNVTKYTMYTTKKMWYARSVVGLVLNNYFVNPLIEKWYVMEISTKLT